ncbi:hypothetical protein [Stygiolobus sp. RP850M]|uniref:hypothetical protein n=1 Tax=Stygiolobus sp. RP850M TaxID=3133137 RepID=UPI00307EC428
MLESYTSIVNLLYVSLLLETSLLFYFVSRKLKNLPYLRKDARPLYLLRIFSEALDLFSSTGLLDNGMIGANFNIKSEALQKFLEKEVKGVGSKIKLINTYISSMEKIDAYISGISSNIKEIFYLILASIISFTLYFIPGFSLDAWIFVPSPIRYYSQRILEARKNLEILKEHSSNSNKSYVDRIKKGMSKVVIFGLIGLGIAIIAAGVILGLNAIHSLPSNNEHVQYLGSGYIGFVPDGQTISYDGHTDPVGELISLNGTTIPNVIWDGQYAGTIIQNHNQIVQLNNQFVGQTDPINNQPYVPLQDFYIIKGQVPVEQVTINGQTYYVIEANNINPADIAGFYTYQGWVNNFVAAMNTPGTIPERLPGNSPVYDWANITEQQHTKQSYMDIMD